MKIDLPLILALLLTCISCKTNENDLLEDGTIHPQISEIGSFETSEVIAAFADSPEPAIQTLPGEMIVKYLPGIPSPRREALRAEFGVVSYKTCNCSSNGNKYELWTLPNSIGIEPTVRVINDGDGTLDIDRVSQNFAFRNPMHSLFSVESSDPVEAGHINSQFNNLYLNRIKPQNSGITIAVLDTGIDTDFPGFSSTFLFNGSGSALCGEESGWDFVNQDSNPYDDYPEIHGTMVSYIIHRELTQKNIDHQILPVKIADSNGVATFFDTLCGLVYATEKQSDVINMSFGWYNSDPYSYAMFSNVIDSTQSILVTSAGNKNNDNDKVKHYPSGFPQDNVFAIAAAKKNVRDAALYTNFGNVSVDFYALGNKIPFPLWTPNTHVNFTGTSFAAPLVSSRVAELLANKANNIRAALIDILGVDVNYAKPVYYKKRIP